jgi:hypothetical protein
MAYKPAEQAKLDHIIKTISMLQDFKIEPSQIKDKINAEFVPEFEKATSTKFIFEKGESLEFKIVDLSKDYLRVRDSNEENKVFRTRVFGVHIEVKTFKKDEFELNNEEIAFSLEQLAAKIRGCNVVLSKTESCDLDDSHFGEQSAAEEAETDKAEQASQEDKEAEEAQAEQDSAEGSASEDSFVEDEYNFNDAAESDDSADFDWGSAAMLNADADTVSPAPENDLADESMMQHL